MKLSLYQQVALKRDLPEHGLKRGDIATLVDAVPHPHGGEEGSILEVFNALGESIAVVTVPESDLEGLHEDEVLSVRRQESKPSPFSRVYGNAGGLAANRRRAAHPRQGGSIMARREGKLKGVQFCGNSNSKEVHDLDNEQTNCQIDEIIKAGHEVPFKTLKEATLAGYDNCAYCLGSSKQ